MVGIINDNDELNNFISGGLSFNYNSFEAAEGFQIIGEIAMKFKNIKSPRDFENNRHAFTLLEERLRHSIY